MWAILESLPYCAAEVPVVPGLTGTFVDDCGNQFILLISDMTLTIWDFRIPWRPLYDALFNELFPHPNKLARHSFNLAPTLLNVAEVAQRFFHPAEMDDMLEAILPKFWHSMDSMLATQTFLVHFLPISHPQRWLPLRKLCIPCRTLTSSLPLVGRPQQWALGRPGVGSRRTAMH